MLSEPEGPLTGALHLHRSNRMERLRDQLIEVVSRVPADPLEPECIVVQGRGMEVWLAQQLADALSVWANPEFPFPRELLERALAQLPDALPPRADPFAPESLMWSIAAILGSDSSSELRDEIFEPVRRYLADDPRGAKRLELAQLLANTFDHYVVYRPEMVLAWERGESGASYAGAAPTDRDLVWQAALWRQLVDRHGSRHLAARARGFLRALEAGELDLATLPSRISVFGLSTLPPLFVTLLQALARSREVHLFVLSASREYWADLRGLGERAAPEEQAGMGREEGHPLLLSLGRLGRDFQQILEERAPERLEGKDLYSDPLAAGDAPRALHVLQSDMLALRRRGAADVARAPLAPDDDSIRLHVCYGPMREAQVLRDQLIDLFERDPSLEPRDVVVMSPDIEAYAPYLEAVFAQPVGGAGRVGIPCRVSDRAALLSSGAIEAFWRLLDLEASRLEASQVLDLLALPVVGERFGMGVADCERLREWTSGAGIRWGRDAEQRGQLDQPAVDMNSWRFGLDRLLLGYAVSDEGDPLFAGCRPYGGIEGGDAELLGRFVDFCELLFDFQGRLEEAHPVPVWRAILSDLLKRALDSGDSHARALAGIQRALGELAEAAERAGFVEAIPLDALRAQLERCLRRRVFSGGFASGGVTLCELVPMRSVPFRVVCLLGMNDEDFPRIRRPLGFDLMARRRLPGDRSSRDDDRHLFLEALLSARDRLIVSYTGCDPRDASTRPASVVVGELLDQLAESFCAGGEAGTSLDRARNRRAVLAQVTVCHPLQPFSPRYFGADEDPRFFSYSLHDCEGARALCQEQVPPTLFVKQSLPPHSEETPDENGGVSLEALQRFFRHPQRTLLRERLELWLEPGRGPVEDREPIVVEGLPRWELGQQLLERAAAGESIEEAFESTRASGVLPLGVPGRLAYGELCREVRGLLARAHTLHASEPYADLELDEEIEGVRIRGRLGDLWPQGRVRVQYARLGSRSEFDVWIEHLLLCLSASASQPRESHLVGRSASGGKKKKYSVHFEAVENPERLLADLLQIRRLGLRAALPLFPKTSRRYVETLRRGGAKPRGQRGGSGRGDPRAATAVGGAAPADERGKGEAATMASREAQAIKQAYEAFRGDEQRPGEWSSDADLRQVFGSVDPLAPDFAAPLGAEPGPGFRELARRVYEPLLAHRSELS